MKVFNSNICDEKGYPELLQSKEDIYNSVNTLTFYNEDYIILYKYILLYI